VRRLSGVRIRDAERRAPKPQQLMTWIETVVEPNPFGGSPIVIGVCERFTTQRHGPSIVENFDPPIPEAELPGCPDASP
jgi:hypothetical protein